MPQNRTRKIVITGVLSALLVFLGLTPLGFIPWGPASLTTMHIPVIIGAILEGPLVGLIIGLVFGIFSMIRAAIAPNGPADVLFLNPLIAVLPRLFIGPVAWLVWKALQRWKIVGILIGGLAAAAIVVQVTRASWSFIQKWSAGALVIAGIVVLLLIALIVWLIVRSSLRWNAISLILVGIAGSLTNSILVLGMIGFLATLNVIDVTKILGDKVWATIWAVLVANGLPEAVSAALLVMLVLAVYWQIPISKRQGANL
ncbi:MAG TPA: ECF transporter S component [Anaerolineaceae bacterium]